MRESFIEKKATNFAKKQGWLAYKLQGQHNKGLPDRIYFKSGVVLLVEYKAPGRKPTKLQACVHQKLMGKGFNVHVIDNIETGKRLFT